MKPLHQQSRSPEDDALDAVKTLMDPDFYLDGLTEGEKTEAMYGSVKEISGGNSTSIQHTLEGITHDEPSTNL